MELEDILEIEKAEKLILAIYEKHKYKDFWSYLELTQNIGKEVLKLCREKPDWINSHRIIILVEDTIRKYQNEENNKKWKDLKIKTFVIKNILKKE